MTQRSIERLAIFCAGVFVGWLVRPTPQPTPPDDKQPHCTKQSEYKKTDARSSAYGKHVVTDITEMIDRRRPAAIENARVEVAKYHLGAAV